MDLKGKMIVRNNNIETAEMGEEVGMLDVETGNYYILNEIGTDIWSLIEKPVAFEQLIDKLRMIYDVDYETCEIESLEFIKEMIENKLIQVMNS